MNPEDMIEGHYYWYGTELYLCVTYLSKETNGWGNALLKRISPRPQVSGAWFSFKHWKNGGFRHHNP